MLPYRTLDRWILSVVVVCSGSAMAQTKTYSFDDIADLSDYSSDGVTFQGNIALWNPQSTDSVLDDPDSGPLSSPRGICAGSCGGEAGSIFLATPQNFVSIWALSGPGSDFLSSDTRIRAKNGSGTVVGEAIADTSLQFDLLAISAPGIVEIELFSPSPINEAWDQLTISDLDLVLQVSSASTAPGLGISFDIAQGQTGGLAMLTATAVNGSPLFVVVTLGPYDSRGRYTLRATVPPGLTGVDVDFQGIGHNRFGNLVLTNSANVVFQ